jgi:hypothetical protein
MRISLIAFVILLIVAGARTSEACSCGEVSPCNYYAKADVVFVGEVLKTSTRTAERKNDPAAISATYTTTEPVTRLRILEAFYGVKSTELEILGSGTTCDVPFVEGKKFLVYASRDQDGKSLYTSICSGTDPIDEVAAHLRYLHSPARMRNGGTVSGSVDRMAYPRRGDPFSVPLAKWKVIFESDHKRFVAIANEKGKYSLSGLPKGHYTVHTSPGTNDSNIPSDDDLPRTAWEIDIPDHGCSWASFGLIPQGEVRGRLLAPGGKKDWPSLSMLSIDRQNNQYSRFYAKFDDNGDFRFINVPAGCYLLGINIGEGPSKGSEYDEFYYPGVRDRKEAVLIVVKKDQKLTGFELPLPDQVSWRTITGTAVYPDGHSAKNAKIELHHLKSGYREGNGERTDSEGRFQIEGLEGQTYELSALIESNGQLVNSKPILITVGKENPPVKLVIKPRRKNRKH